MKTSESDPFFYEGSEDQKADLAAQSVAQAGGWESFMNIPASVSAEIIKQAQIPDRPPEYRDFKGTTTV